MVTRKYRENGYRENWMSDGIWCKSDPCLPSGEATKPCLGGPDTEVCPWTRQLIKEARTHWLHKDYIILRCPAFIIGLSVPLKLHNREGRQRGNMQRTDVKWQRLQLACAHWDGAPQLDPVLASLPQEALPFLSFLETYSGEAWIGNVTLCKRGWHIHKRYSAPA